MNKPEYPITQGFGENPATYAPLKGHPGVDYDGGYGAPVHAIWGNEYVYKILDESHPANDGTGYTGVFTIVEQNGECFEFQYGHGDPKVQVGQTLNKGDVVMTEANHGMVFSNGVRITLDMQKNGDRRGAHVHGQKRPLTKRSSMEPDHTYLSAFGGSPLINGSYYAYKYPNNGYSGCTDWTQPGAVLEQPKAIFTKDLYLGMTNDDVLELQKLLVKYGYGTFKPTGYFGILTLASVIAYQKAKRISPALGYVGKLTRAELNK